MDNSRALQIDITREGLYDSLPEGLFHQPKSRNPNRNTQEMVDEVKRRRTEEMDARKLFAPLESEFYQQRTQLELVERKLLFELETGSSQSWLLQFWKLEAYAADSRIFRLIKFLPICYRIAGDLQKMELCYQLILQMDVKLSLVHQTVYHSTNKTSNPLKNMRLGVNSTLGSGFYENLPYVVIELGPLSDEEIPEYLKEGSGNKLLELINSYFMPAGLHTEIKIIPIKSKHSSVLGKSRLGLGVNLEY